MENEVGMRLAEWSRQLLETSARNRLINLRSPSGRHTTLQLADPDAATIYARLLDEQPLKVRSRRDDISVSSDDDGELGELPEGDQQGRIRLGEGSQPEEHFVLGSNDIETSLRLSSAQRMITRLLKASRVSLQEQGVNTLYAAFGVLDWQEAGGASSRPFRGSPLILVPVTIEENKKNNTVLLMGTGEPAELNLTLSERLQTDFHIDPFADVPRNEQIDFREVVEKVRRSVAGKPTWSVSEECHVGVFQFHKLRMYRDLVDNIELASGHELVRVLLGLKGLEISDRGEPDAREIDAFTGPGVTFSILDADSSQMAAVCDVSAGENLIVQGPPGTGKSQTIANMIAECVARGKTVLFVSEKSAALEVVYRRLVGAGLGSLVLPLHSTKEPKDQVIAELYQISQEGWGIADSGGADMPISELPLIREELNAYPEVLHTSRDPFGKSVFWAYGELAKLTHVAVPATYCGPAWEGLEVNDLDRWKLRMESFLVHYELLKNSGANPWRSLAAGVEQTVDPRAVLRLVRSADELFRGIIEKSAQLSSLLGLPSPDTSAEVEHLVRVALAVPDRELRPSWFEEERRRSALDLIANIVSKLDELKRSLSSIQSSYRSEFLELDHESILLSYNQNAVVRLFSGSYRAHRGHLKALQKTSTALSALEERQILELTVEYKRDRHTLLAHSDQLVAEIGQGLEALRDLETESLQQSYAAIEQIGPLVELFPTARPPRAFIDRVTSAQKSPDVNSLAALLEAVLTQVGDLAKALDDRISADEDTPGCSWSDLTFSQAVARTETLLFNESQLASWLRFIGIREDIKHAGLTEIIDSLLVSDVAPEEWYVTVRKELLGRWVEDLILRDPVLRAFDGRTQETRIGQFRTLDRVLIQSTPVRMRERFQELGHREVVRHAAAGEPAVLRREANKKRRKLSLRSLFAQMPNLLLDLKPVMMMSPLSIAQYLPAGAIGFDVVIFDEASQVRPHDALGAIMRAAQVVVAGDKHQLPPTSFFDRVAEDIDDSDAEDFSATDMESILDALDARGMKSRSLQWHYRSRHEDLIAFSNHHIYQNRLVTFPTPDAASNAGLGVKMEYVPNGAYVATSRGRSYVGGRSTTRANEIEARRVVDLVAMHARAFSAQSLIVVALGESQADAIERELQQRLREDEALSEWIAVSELSPEPFAIKALEKVQGDERDVVIISIGYGRDESGRINYRFGPMNQAVGRRRLNVLVTRARLKTIVVSSVRASDLDDSRLGGPESGMRLLKQYLEYAEEGRSGTTRGTVEGDGGFFDSAFEEEVCDGLISRGYEVRSQIGASGYRIDLGVVDPDNSERYIVGIECDGAAYHSSRSARDRDRLRQEVLEGYGWRLLRVWSTDWFHDASAVLDKLVERIEDIRMDDVRRGRADDVDGEDVAWSTLKQSPPELDVDLSSMLLEQESLSPSPRHTAVAAEELTAERYVIATVDKVGGDILNASYSLIRQVALACLDVEAPIHRTLLNQRVSSVWGNKRTGHRIQNRISGVLETMRSNGEIEIDGEDVSLPGRDLVRPRGEDASGKTRSIELVPSRELQLAITLVLDDARSLSDDELVVAVSRLLGYRRSGEGIRARILAELGTLVQRGSVEFWDERYRVK
ncbi:MAG: DUF3320 domain-containing protein [Thermomicrobiales bacterium]